jgi:hypothetical protein
MGLLIFHFFLKTLALMNRGVLFLLLLLFLSLILFFLVSVFLHERKKRYLARMTVVWKEMIRLIFEQEITRMEFAIPQKDRKDFRELLLNAYLHSNQNDQKKIRQLYEHLGFLNEDLFVLRSRVRREKVEALGRLTVMHFEEAEAVVIDLLEDRSREVRMSALKMLSSVNSQSLFELLPEIFEDRSRWKSQDLVNILFVAEIPAENLKMLAASLNGEMRKAAALLLGADGKEEAIPMLHVLAKDPVKEVRREAVTALGRINSDETVAMIARKSFDQHPGVRESVAKALRNARGNQKLPILNRLANDPEYNVRYHAFFALNLMGPNGKEVIQGFSNKYPDLVQKFVPAVCQRESVS